MAAKFAILTSLLICCNGLSIGTVSDRNVKPSETRIGDSFPDWVPFKNKHGDELGEFSPVSKSKIRKRLAEPMNFILRAVAEPEGDDYYDKGQGGGDSEDNYENKDWSDLHRLAEAVDNNKQLNHTEISDIEGVVNILTRKPANYIADAINNARQINTKLIADELDEDEEEEITTETSTTEGTRTKTKQLKNNEDDDEYDESSSEKQKVDPVEDVSESKARKAKILDAVDELKERHAEESRTISEKADEEMYKEEFERNRLHPVETKDKYGNRKKYKKITPDYDEYEDKNTSLEDKYKVRRTRIETTSQQPSRTTSKEKNKGVESGKLSVFKNPQLYMTYDDAEETSVKPKLGNQKFSSRYTSTPPIDNDDERISLVPEDSKEGEPTLFFPKKRKSKRRKIKTTPATESYITEIVTENLKHITAIDTTAADTRTDTTLDTAPSASADDVTGSGSDVASSSSKVTEESSAADTTGADVTPTNTDRVIDAAPASSDHKKEKSADYHNEKGGGQEHDSEHEEEHEEHGKKAYEGHHEDTKTAKGHHDKDNHLGKYEDHGGVDKHHDEESGHYGKHHHEEHGKKHAKYEESGKHSKGHSTKGSHDVHKKEEYEKKVEFFDEDGDSAEEEKHGGYNNEREHSEGGKFKKGNLNAGHQHHSKGESGHFGKAGHSDSHKGHREAAGRDSHGKHGAKHFHKNGKDGGKTWVYHHGMPARTANLVVIDRRGDQMYHGPHYYG